MSESITFSNEALAERCTYWQRVLRLQDWTVQVRLARATEMGEDAPKSRSGEVEWSNPMKTATILILDEEDYARTHRSGFERVQDMEITLVHELMHLHFAPLAHVITANSVEDRFEEQAVEALARALVALKRGDV